MGADEVATARFLRKHTDRNLYFQVNLVSPDLGRHRAGKADRTNALSDTKGWERRVVPISDRLWSALKALDTARCHVVSRHEGDVALQYNEARDAVLAIYKRAGVTPPPKPWHSLRHTFCTELARAGVPVHVIKELAGHKSIETTLRYMHTDRAAKRDAIDALRRALSPAARADRG